MAAFDDGASAHTDEEREILTWPLFGQASRELAQTIVDDRWTPDVVVAVARGGLLPAGAVAYALGIKAMGTMNVEFYTDVAQTLEEPRLLDPAMDTSSLRDQRVLVVDDVADSGKTLAKVMEMFAEFPGVEARSAVIYHKPRSVMKPDYVWKMTEKWIMFPWSDKPPVTAK